MMYWTVLEKSIPTPWKVIGNSSGKEDINAKILEAKYEVKLEFLGGRGGGGGKTKNLPWGGGGYGYFLELHIQ